MSDMPALFDEDRSQHLGTWVKLRSSESVEIVAHAGFDFVVIDLEHTLLDLASVYQHIGAARGCGVVPLVRVPAHDASFVQRVLDGGAAGVLVPHVDTVEQASSVARMVRFPPAGTRGSGHTSRAGGWGTATREDYLHAGNQEALCIPQLESELAMRNAAGILGVPGVDAVLIGSADLALSMGVPAGDPRLTELIRSVLDAAREAGRPCGTAVGTSTAAVKAFEQGYGFVVTSNDTSLLMSAARAVVRDVRAVSST